MAQGRVPSPTPFLSIIRVFIHLLNTSDQQARKQANNRQDWNHRKRFQFSLYCNSSILV